MIKTKLSASIFAAAFLFVAVSLTSPAYAKDNNESNNGSGGGSGSIMDAFGKIYEGKVVSFSNNILVIKNDGNNTTFDTKTANIIGGTPEAGDEVKVTAETPKVNPKDKKAVQQILIAKMVKVQKKDKNHYGHDGHDGGDDNGQGGNGDDDNHNGNGQGDDNGHHGEDLSNRGIISSIVNFFKKFTTLKEFHFFKSNGEFHGTWS